VFGEIYPGDATLLGDPARDIAYRWVRHGNLKLIIPHADQTGKPWNKYILRTALYDLSRDPMETVNLAGEPDRTADVTRLREMLDDWWPVDRSEEE
jgi:hypothetical protein